MKRLLTAVAGLSLITGFTFAQMDDVPFGHWAYDAIEYLVREGIIQGYPDGKFRPERTMTRAEFAEAIARAYRRIDERIRALNAEIERIKQQSPAPTGGQQPAPDTRQLEERVRNLENAVNELRRLNEAVQTLQRLGQTFQQELADLNVNVDSLKKDLASLRDRVSALEGREEKFKMSGDLSFGVFGTHSLDGTNPITANAHPLYPSGKFLESLNVVHELGLTFSGQINEEVSGSATFILGNFLPFAGGAGKSALTINADTKTAPAVGNTDITIWEAYVKAPLDLFGTKVDLVVGRFPAKFTDFTLKRIKPNTYLNFPRYDDGFYRVDGGALAFNFDTFRLNLWAAKTNLQSNNGVFSGIGFENHNSATSSPADQFAGAYLEFDAIRGEDTNLTIGAIYYAAGIGTGQNFNFAGGAPEAANIDRVDVFGANVKAKFAGIRFGAEYAQSDFLRDTTRVINKENWALNANIGYDFSENLSVTAGYLEVRPYFASPGSWGRVGYLYNPSDLRGPYAGVNWKASEDLNVSLTGAFLEGTDRVPGGYTKNEELVHVVAGVGYRLSDRWNFKFDYEGAFWKAAGAKPVWNYLTLGVGYNLGENATLNALYQIIDNNTKGLAGFGAVGAGKGQGAVAATTLTIKF